METAAKPAASRRQSWSWPEDSGENETFTDLNPTHDTNSSSRLAHARFPINIAQHIEPPPGFVWTSPSSEFCQPFEPVQQSIVQKRNVRYPTGNSFIRHDHVEHISYHAQHETGWHLSAERPGGPTTTLSYTSRSTGPIPWWGRALIGTWVMIWLTMMVYYVWGWWMGWFKVSAQPTSTCWNIGIPIGPVYIGYGCRGWFLEFFGFIII